MTTILQMKRDEAAPAALLSIHLFLTVASMVTGKAARDAIFLSRFTALQMIAVDLVTMVAIALVASYVPARRAARTTAAAEPAASRAPRRRASSGSEP